MSDDKDPQRISDAADNCEVLRARLAKYEDAEGRPLQSGVVDERAAFEAAVCERYGYTGGSIISRRVGDYYADASLSQAWALWQARVALTASAPSHGEQVRELLEWAVDCWHAEVSQRPLINVHRRALDGTWRQVIRKLGGDPVDLCGPDHSTLLAEVSSAGSQGGDV